MIVWKQNSSCGGYLEWGRQRRRSATEWMIRKKVKKVAAHTWLKRRAQLDAQIASAFRDMTRDEFNSLPWEAVQTVAQEEIAAFGFGGTQELRHAWSFSRQWQCGLTGHAAQTPVASKAGVGPVTLCLDSEPPAQG